MHALWLVNQLRFIVPVNPRKNRASSEYYIKAINHKFSMGYTLEEFVNKFFSCSTNIPRGLSAYKPQKLLVYRLIIKCL